MVWVVPDSVLVALDVLSRDVPNGPLVKAFQRGKILFRDCPGVRSIQEDGLDDREIEFSHRARISAVPLQDPRDVPPPPSRPCQLVVEQDGTAGGGSVVRPTCTRPAQGSMVETTMAGGESAGKMIVLPVRLSICT